MWEENHLCRWMKTYRETNPQLNHTALMDTLESLRSVPESKRAYCHTCSLLLSSSAVSPDHVCHDLRYGLEDTLLSQPTKLLSPRDDKKSNAVSLYLCEV